MSRFAEAATEVDAVEFIRCYPALPHALVALLNIAPPSSFWLLPVRVRMSFSQLLCRSCSRVAGAADADHRYTLG
jgi:hypothetical protein